MAGENTVDYNEASNIGTAIFMIFYGIYVIIFAVTMRLLLTKKADYDGHKWNVASLSLIFLFITLYISVTLPLNILDVQHDPTAWLKSSARRHMVHVQGSTILLSHAIADCILVRRCYLVWAGRKSIIILPCLVLLSSVAMGITFLESTMGHIAEFGAECSGTNEEACRQALAHKWGQYLKIYYSLCLATSLLATSLTAGRISWLAYRGKQILGEKMKNKYRVLILVILESGMIYSGSLICQICFLTIPTPKSLYKLSLVADALMVPSTLEIAGIASTLLFLRANLIARRKPPPSTGAPVSTLQFGSSGLNSGSRQKQSVTLAESTWELESRVDSQFSPAKKDDPFGAENGGIKVEVQSSKAF